MRLAVLVLAVSILVSGAVVAWSITRASSKPVDVRVNTCDFWGNSGYGGNGSAYAGNGC